MTTITALPAAPNRSTDAPATYVTKADAMMAALPTFVTETNTVAGEVNTNATTATTQATNAATSASTAAANVAFAMRWNFDSATTMADPGSADLRFNNATPASVTAIAVSANSADTGNPSVSAAVLTWDDSTTTTNRGTLTVRKIGSPGTFAQYQITGATTDNTTWLQLTVTYTAGNGTFSNTDSLAVGFVRTGDLGGITGGTLTGNLVGGDYTISQALLKDTGLVFLDKGNSGTSTQTLDYTAGSHQKITATGNHTIATSNWPPTGNLGVIILEAANFGAYTVTWPTINWVKPDGTTTTSVSTWLAAITGRTAFQSSGTDFIKLWTRDAGTTIYGGFAA